MEDDDHHLLDAAPIDEILPEDEDVPF